MTNGISSIAELRNAIEAGQIGEINFQTVATTRNTVQPAWMDLFSSSGVKTTPLDLSASAGVATQLTSSTTGALPLNEGNVSPKKRYLLDVQVNNSGATTVPLTGYLCDLLLYYNISLNSATSLNNTATLPRYTDGVGVQAIVTQAGNSLRPFENQTGPTSLSITYTDSANNSTSSSLYSNAMIAPTTTTVTVQTLPAGIAITPDNSKVLVCNNTTGSVSVITVSNNSVTNITGLSFPCGIAVMPDGSHAYFVNRGGNQVKAIDLSNNTISATISSVGTNPIGIAINPAGTLVYAVGGSSKNLYEITISSNTITHTIDLTNGGANTVDGPSAVAVNPAGTFAYVTNTTNTDQAYYKVNLSTYAVTRVAVASFKENSLAINPAGTKMYISGSANGTIKVIDLSTDTVTATISVANASSGTQIQVNSLAINSTGSYMYATSDSGFCVIDLATNTVVSTYTYATTSVSGAGSVCIDSTGTFIYFSNGGSGATNVVYAAASNPNELFTAQTGTDAYGSAASTGSGGPFLPMGSSGQGIKHIDSYTITNSQSANATAILVKPLMAFSVANFNTPSEKDMFFQYLSAPQIQDGACLGLIVGGVSNVGQVYNVRIRYVWV